MFHSRKLNSRINNIHERALRIVYKDFVSTFAELLNKDNSCTIHERNIQALGIELYKVANGLSPLIMSQVFLLKDNIRYPSENMFKTRNVKSLRYGTETLAHLGPKIWSIIPSGMKEEQSLKLFTKKIKQWKPERCPCKLCKTYVRGLGYINELFRFELSILKFVFTCRVCNAAHNFPFLRFNFIHLFLFYL